MNQPVTGRRGSIGHRRRVAALVAGAVVAATLTAGGHPVAGGPLPDAPPAPGGGGITVEILTDQLTDPTVAAAEVEALGGSILDMTPSGVLLARVPLGRLASLRASSSGYVRAPEPLDVRPHPADAARGSGDRLGLSAADVHITTTNADRWHRAGLTGAGVRVGVIDFFNVPAHWDEPTMGPPPRPNVNAVCFDAGRDCIGEMFAPVPRPGDDHGPAVVELIRDMAPDAEIFIGRATTESDYYRLVDWFAERGVRIVNRSLGSRYDGPGDGRGALTAVADYAVGRNITWVNSVGNNAIERYYRQPVRLAGDLVAFGPSGNDTWLPFVGCIALAGIRWAGDWDRPPAERTDYDAFLIRAPAGNPAAGEVFASATARQTAGAPPLENFALGQVCPGPGQQFFLQVRLVSGSPEGDVLEVLDYADGIGRWTQAAYSAAAPVVDSRSPGVLAVGAIDPPGSGRIGNYSSRGPTNDGRITPALAAPSGIASATFGGTFSGTSASAPVVAGAAALLLGAGLASDARSLGDLVRHSVIDRGPAGRDTAYGTGELHLPPPPSSTQMADPATYRPLPTPVRVLDTRPASAIGPGAAIGDPWAGRIIDLPVSAIPGADPASVTAVAANVTIVEAERIGFTQAFPTRRAALASFSNSNIDTSRQTRPNLMIVPVGEDGRYSIYTTSGGHVLVDVLGTFATPAGSADQPVRAGRLVGLERSQRVLDTRGRGTPVMTGTRVAFGLPTGVDPTYVAALVVNVTATDTRGTGFVQAIPAGRADQVGRTSTLNLSTGSTVANTTIVPVTDGGVELYVDLGPGGSAHLIADVTGYVTSDRAPSSTDGRFVALRPGRAFDSRRAGAVLRSGEEVEVRAADVAGLALPRRSSAVVWNLTVSGTSGPGFLQAWPSGALAPETSALNWTSPDTTTANAAIVPASSDGVLRLRVDAGPLAAGRPLTHVIVDVFGYLT